ncbi:MAG: AAA family ATPase [Clostridia bacterium]
MNEKSLVRILKVELNNFKNVNSGNIKFMNYCSVEKEALVKNIDLVGIYGQNGSGKTAMVEALDMLQYILSGKEIDFSKFSGLMNEEKNTKITTYFYIEGNQGYKVKYEVELKKNVETKKIEIFSEILTSWVRGSKWKSEKSVYFQNPFYDMKAMLKNDAAEIKTTPSSYKKELIFANFIQNLGIYSAQNNVSLFFNQLMIDILIKENCESVPILTDILKQMSIFANCYFHIVKVDQLGIINSSDVLPINFHQEYQGVVSNGCLPLFMNGFGVIPEKVYSQLERAISSINIAIKSVVPNLKIELEKASDDTDKDGNKIVKVEVYSVRDEKKFLTKYESEGIKRIISLLNYLISAYNDPRICLVIDELDAGIFEYVLGDLLGAFYENAKGQLIFTSHNLRILERLSMKNIVCSTTNPDNRYIVLKGVDTNNNHRDFYIRALSLGGQNEELYDNNDLQSIEYAFRNSQAKKSEVDLRFSDEINQMLQD